ncbi:TonB-dependent receptor [Sphingomonas lutea]|uniref:TonB-dependent receptor n=1 Tax=Sphingomonas lutea TaxID=1045317 RepID=A0A7G9SFM6_9SPHN|nr:TonB-dependent receptor [Sphingomonas lutea]QNN66651.1 TonB-dependent receptor [Sphingomonas lutea]
MRSILLLSSAACLALNASEAVRAQTPAGDEPPVNSGQTARSTSYDAAFFAQYAPRTALDIARRVPGFTLDLGNTDTRGFAGAAGNVVINGARPSSKSESLETTLQRIPASSVTRVEVGPGDLYGADYASKSQVLNIVMSAVGGIDGNVTASLRRLYTGRVDPNASASMLIRRGASSINLSAGFNNVVNAEEGSDTLRGFEDGELREFRRKFNIYKDFNPYIGASWALERAQDNAIRVNARYSPGQFDLEQRNRVTATGEPPHDDSLIQDYDNSVFELGGDITRPLGGGAIKLVGLATRRKRNNFDAYIARDGLLEDDPAVVGGSEQTQKAKFGETIGRLTWTRQDVAGFSVELGGEAVLNTLDNSTALTLIEEDGTKTPVDLAGDNVQVKEKRGEIFLNAGRNLRPALRVDGGLRFEYSDLKVSGDAEAKRKLKFFKPSLTIDWKPGNGWHTQFSVKRTVAQLNFYDFVSVAELSTDRVNAGNENLVPQRAWEWRLTADRPILGDGVIKLDLGYDHISLLQDRVLVPGEKPGQFFDAPGNIGTGKLMFATLSVDAPLGQLWKGLRLKADGTLRRTRVEDPISGEMRNFSDFFPDWQWNVEMRRDSGPWSYGFTVSDRDRFTFFRTEEFDINYNGGPYGTAFVEYRPGPRTSVTLDVDNALNTPGNRHRIRFNPNRAAPLDIIDELRERNRHLNVGLTIKQTFGGGAAKASPSGP